ncbi:MAG: hypothetical protein J6U53_00275 [Tidjanibacter sp.]|nr:hypothetical protein [Tidjanibacter sp.]
MEILNDNGRGATPAQPQDRYNGCGQIVVTALKVIGWIIGIGWLLSALGLLLSFITLVAIGVYDANYISGIEGVSPVVFAGLIVAVIVLGMGILADLWFKLLRSKRVNFRNLIISGVVWLVFFGWLCVVGVKNYDNWTIWAEQAEANLELWEERMEQWGDDFEERFEEHMEQLDRSMEAVEEELEKVEETLESL